MTTDVDFHHQKRRIKMKCSWIENMISIETDGYTRACCLETGDSARVSDIALNGLSKSFNHPILLKLQKDLDRGFSEETKNFCYRCENLEKKNQPSMRTGTQPLSERREIKLVQFKLSNKCQLACAHCGSDRSSTWAKINKVSPHVIKSFTITDEFVDELLELLPAITVLKFSGGEPFLDPDHWRLLERIKHANRGHCEIQYITNGLVKPRPDLWNGWREIKCSVSVDGFEDSYEWFRRGASWNDLVENVQELEKISKVSLNYSLTPYTVADYNRAKSFWKYNLDVFPIVYPEHCSMFKFPLRYIKLLDNCQEIPLINSCSTSDSNINIYRNWARKSDEMWNTIGSAERLFWWMK